MSYPVERGAPGAPAEKHNSDGYESEEPQADETGDTWDEGSSAFPLAYAYPEDVPAPDYASEQEAADIEAALLSDLEAAATAFWLDFDPDEDASPRDAGDDQSNAPGSGSGQFEFHWETTPEDLIGPEVRRTQMAFRPPRRRERDASPTADHDMPTVNFDVHATPDGAFADDLAARNKEFYELLKSNSAVRKIAVPDGRARGPGFESIFPRAEPASGRNRAYAERGGGGGGLMRQAAAAAILAVVVGVGLFIIGQQFAVPAASDEEVALLPDERPPTAPRAANDPVETSAIPETTVAKTVEAPPLAITTGIDPGTLATPPLYEKPTPPSPVPDQSAAPELAAIPLRTDTGESVEAPAPGAAIVTEEPAVTEALSPAEDSPAEIAAASPAAETPAEPLRESVTIDTPPAKKATSTSEPSRSAVGSGKVNSAVNMRAGPDNNEKVVRVLRAGTPVEILNSCKVWCEVVANGDRGFIFQRFITRTGGGSAQAEPPEPAGGIVRTSLAEDTSVGSPDETGGPLNLLRFGRPNN